VLTVENTPSPHASGLSQSSTWQAGVWRVALSAVPGD
jgi:hypothetical protein